MATQTTPVAQRDDIVVFPRLGLQPLEKAMNQNLLHHALAPKSGNGRKIRHGEKFRRHLRTGMPVLPG
jgi:hypothetical protein